MNVEDLRQNGVRLRLRQRGDLHRRLVDARRLQRRVLPRRQRADQRFAAGAAQVVDLFLLLRDARRRIGQIRHRRHRAEPRHAAAARRRRLLGEVAEHQTGGHDHARLIVQADRRAVERGQAGARIGGEQAAQVVRRQSRRHLRHDRRATGAQGLEQRPNSSQLADAERAGGGVDAHTLGSARAAVTGVHAHGVTVAAVTSGIIRHDRGFRRRPQRAAVGLAAEDDLDDERARGAVGKRATAIDHGQRQGRAPRFGRRPHPGGQRRLGDRRIDGDDQLAAVADDRADRILRGGLDQRHRQAATPGDARPIQADGQVGEHGHAVGVGAQVREGVVAAPGQGHAADVALPRLHGQVRVAQLAGGEHLEHAVRVHAARAGAQGARTAGGGFVSERDLETQTTRRHPQLQVGALLGGQLHGAAGLGGAQAQDRGGHLQRLLARGHADLGGAQARFLGDAEAVAAAAAGNVQVGLLGHRDVRLEAAAARVCQADDELAEPRVVVVGEHVDLATGGGDVEVVDHHHVLGELAVTGELGDLHAPGFVPAGQRRREHRHGTAGVDRGAVDRGRGIETGVRHGQLRAAHRGRRPHLPDHAGAHDLQCVDVAQVGLRHLPQLPLRGHRAGQQRHVLAGDRVDQARVIGVDHVHRRRMQRHLVGDGLPVVAEDQQRVFRVDGRHAPVRAVAELDEDLADRLRDRHDGTRRGLPQCRGGLGDDGAAEGHQPRPARGGRRGGQLHADAVFLLVEEQLRAAGGGHDAHGRAARRRAGGPGAQFLARRVEQDRRQPDVVGAEILPRLPVGRIGGGGHDVAQRRLHQPARAGRRRLRQHAQRTRHIGTDVRGEARHHRIDVVADGLQLLHQIARRRPSRARGLPADAGGVLDALDQQRHDRLLHTGVEHHQPRRILARAGFRGRAVEKRDVGQAQLPQDFRDPLDRVLDEGPDVAGSRIQLQARRPVGPQIGGRRNARRPADQGGQQHRRERVGDAAGAVDVDGFEQRAEETVDPLHLVHPDAAPGDQGLRVGVGRQRGQPAPEVGVRGGEPGAEGIRIMRRIGHGWVHTLLYGSR